MPMSSPFARAGMFVALFAVILLGAAPAHAQLQPMGQGGSTPKTSTSSPSPAHSAASSGGHGTRVFMSNSSSWKSIGGWGLAGQSTGGRGAPADADGMKAFEKHCSQYPLTNDRDEATFVILLDQINTKKPVKGRDRITVYNRAGIRVYSNSTRLLDDSIKDACHAMEGKK